MTALNSQIAALVVALLGGLPSEAETNESRADALGYGLRYEEGIPSRERKQLDGSFEEALTKACAPPPCTKNCTGARSALGLVVAQLPGLEELPVPRQGSHLPPTASVKSGVARTRGPGRFGLSPVRRTI